MTESESAVVTILVHVRGRQEKSGSGAAVSGDGSSHYFFHPEAKTEGEVRNKLSEAGFILWDRTFGPHDAGD